MENSKEQKPRMTAAEAWRKKMNESTLSNQEKIEATKVLMKLRKVQEKNKALFDKLGLDHQGRPIQTPLALQPIDPTTKPSSPLLVTRLEKLEGSTFAPEENKALFNKQVLNHQINSMPILPDMGSQAESYIAKPTIAYNERNEKIKSFIKDSAFLIFLGLVFAGGILSEWDRLILFLKIPGLFSTLSTIGFWVIVVSFLIYKTKEIHC